MIGGIGRMAAEYLVNDLQMVLSNYSSGISPYGAVIAEREKVIAAIMGRVPSPHTEDFLTPRDEFAKAAMQGELASQHENAFWRKTDELASRCYLVADSMLEARKGSKP